MCLSPCMCIYMCESVYISVCKPTCTHVRISTPSLLVLHLWNFHIIWSLFPSAFCFIFFCTVVCNDERLWYIRTSWTCNAKSENDLVCVCYNVQTAERCSLNEQYFFVIYVFIHLWNVFCYLFICLWMNEWMSVFVFLFIFTVFIWLYISVYSFTYCLNI